MEPELKHLMTVSNIKNYIPIAAQALGIELNRQEAEAVYFSGLKIMADAKMVTYNALKDLVQIVRNKSAQINN